MLNIYRKSSLDMNNLNISETTAHPLALYKNHLEFNGYQVIEKEAESLLCTHRRKMNLILHDFRDRGVLIMSIFSGDRTINRSKLLAYINELNSEFFFIKAHLDEENDLILRTFFAGEYDRINFSILLDNIEYDEHTLLNHELTSFYLS